MVCLCFFFENDDSLPGPPQEHLIGSRQPWMVVAVSLLAVILGLVAGVALISVFGERAWTHGVRLIYFKAVPA